MIDRFALIFLLAIAVCFLVRIWIERREHNRELDERRRRHYCGGPLK